jgi:hypothetical protein
MIISICDLCDNVIKEKEKWLLFLAPVNSGQYTYSEYQKIVSDKSKEICLNCKKLIDCIFLYRWDEVDKIKDKMAEITALPEYKKLKKKK